MTVVPVKKTGPTKNTVEFPPLTHADRCDGARSAQGLVRLVRGTQDLVLSGHYFEASEAALIGAGWEVYEDIRDAVLNPPKSTFDTSEN